jgi:hypothetical protein
LADPFFLDYTFGMDYFCRMVRTMTLNEKMKATEPLV